MSLRRRNVEKCDATTRDATDCKNRVQHPGRMMVGGVPGATGNFEGALTAGEGLTYVGAMSNMRGRPCE